MTEYEKRKTRECFAAIVKAYEKLSDETTRELCDEVAAQGAWHYLHSIIVDMLVRYNCLYRIPHKCEYHDYNNDGQCVICGNYLNYDKWRDNNED